LAPYLKNLTVPVIDANIDVSREEKLQGLFNATMIKEVGGVKIGLIGYITTDTAFISNAGLNFCSIYLLISYICQKLLLH
jgi:5'-nucleotidase